MAGLVTARLGDYSPGPPAVTVWKGFAASQAKGMELLEAAPAGP